MPRPACEHSTNVNGHASPGRQPHGSKDLQSPYVTCCDLPYHPEKCIEVIVNAQNMSTSKTCTATGTRVFAQMKHRPLPMAEVGTIVAEELLIRDLNHPSTQHN